MLKKIVCSVKTGKSEEIIISEEEEIKVRAEWAQEDLRRKKEEADKLLEEQKRVAMKSKLMLKLGITDEEAQIIMGEK